MRHFAVSCLKLSISVLLEEWHSVFNWYWLLWDQYGKYERKKMLIWTKRWRYGDAQDIFCFLQIGFNVSSSHPIKKLMFILIWLINYIIHAACLSASMYALFFWFYLAWSLFFSNNVDTGLSSFFLFCLSIMWYLNPNFSDHLLFPLSFYVYSVHLNYYWCELQTFIDIIIIVWHDNYLLKVWKVSN